MSLLIVIELEDLIELPGPAAKAEADRSLHGHPALLQLPIVPPEKEVPQRLPRLIFN